MPRKLHIDETSASLSLCLLLIDLVVFDRLEERQRAEKRTRESKKDEFKPKWFELTDEMATTPWGELEVYRYNGKYEQYRAGVGSSDKSSQEFDPWQYHEDSQT